MLTMPGRQFPEDAANPLRGTARDSDRKGRRAAHDGAMSAREDADEPLAAGARCA